MVKAILIGGGSNVAEYNPDDYDKVCVINHGIQEVDKCDIWFSGLSGDTYELGEGKEFDELCLTSIQDSLSEKYPKKWKDKVTKVSNARYTGIRNRLKSKPTTGLVAMDELIRRAYDIWVTGFDFYATPNRFGRPSIPESHNFIREKKIYELWLWFKLIKEL